MPVKFIWENKSLVRTRVRVRFPSPAQNIKKEDRKMNKTTECIYCHQAGALDIDGDFLCEECKHVEDEHVEEEE